MDPEWTLGETAFAVVVWIGIVLLAVAIVAIVSVLIREVRHGKVW